MQCSACDSQNRPGRKFCAACGAPLVIPCDACGFANEPEERFCGGCGAKLDKAAPTAAPPATAARSEPQAASAARRYVAPSERRQVTALFADISGFTLLSKKLDPEDTHALVQTFFKTVDAIVESYGGNVDKHIGDAVMAVFGAPVAHGDDPLRAVRTAVEIHEAVERLSRQGPHPYSAHIGIASGEVVVGGTGEFGHEEFTVVGASVNLAARLQEQAKSRETLISPAVHSALSEEIVCEPVTAPNPDEPGKELKCWRVLAIETERPETPRSPMAGREIELRHFEAVGDTARRLGYGGAILIRGDAGIGKTRLVEEYGAIARANGFRHHSTQVLDFGAGESQDAIRTLIRSLLDISLSDEEDRRLEAVSTAVSRGIIRSEQDVFLHDLLNVKPPERLRVGYAAMDNATRFEGKRNTIAQLIKALSAETPLVITVEDLHWARPVTLDYLAGFLEAIAHCPVVLVMTTRTEGDPTARTWRGGVRGVSLVAIDLSPLRREEAECLAAQYVDRSKGYIATCIERADGNPLFLEQLLRNVEEQRGTHLPATIQSLVLSRMDRLEPSDREALQAAAVIGQRFALDALCHLLDRPGLDCSRLLDSQLIRNEGDGFGFSHSLIREGAYSSLLHARARNLHRKAAEYFRVNEPTLAAEHLDKAGDPSAAEAYLTAAGHEQQRYHFVQARLLVERGLEIADAGEIAFELNCSHGELLHLLGEPTASVEAFSRAKEVAASDTERCRATIGQVEGLRDSQSMDEALALLAEAQAIAERLELAEYLARIHGQRGNLYFPRGEVEACLEQQSLSLQYAKRARSPSHEARALSGLGDAEYARGRMKTAHGHFDDCVTLCRAHDFGRIEAPNLALRGLTRFYCAEPRACVEDCEAAIQAASDARQLRAELVARTASAPAQIEMLDLDGAKRQCHRAMEIIEHLGARRFLPECLSFLAKVQLLEGRTREAVKQARQAVQLSLENDAGRSFTGPWALGTLAVVSRDDDVRAKALAEGAEILEQGCVSHNYLWFYRDAVEATLRAREWDAALAHADALEAFTAAEPLGWSTLYISIARCIASGAQAGWKAGRRDVLSGLEEQARNAGLAKAARLAGELTPAD